jgi:NAD(P)-dependent dehydrogenase (short-subunit alcohol dehydrogenase family)
MSSIAGRVAWPLIGPYTASKFAFEAVSDVLRREVGAHGVHVITVEPGSIATPIWQKGDAAAAQAAARFPPAAAPLYGAVSAAMRKAAADAARRGVPPDTVAVVVQHALTARSPRTRYLVGADAKLRARLAAFVPDRLRDRLLTRVLRLPAWRSAEGTVR